MLARQSAPLPREFCKVSACFIFNSQCGHAAHSAPLSQGNLELSCSCRAARAEPFPSFQHVHNITHFPKPRRDASRRLQCEQAQGRHYQGRQAEWGQGLRTVRKYWELTNSPPRSLLTENKVCQMTSPTGVRKIGAESVFLSPMKFSTGPTNSMYQRNGFRKQ